MNRVQRGIKHLNGHLDDPEWWIEINIIDFDINNSKECILGQLFGDYSTGLIEASVPFGEEVNLGFLARSPRERETLSRLWVAEILTLQGESECGDFP